MESSKGEKSLERMPVLRELAAAERALGLHDASVNHLLQVSRSARAAELSGPRTLLFRMFSLMSGRRGEGGRERNIHEERESGSPASCTPHQGDGAPTVTSWLMGSTLNH